jgi:hypothetical protein
LSASAATSRARAARCSRKEHVHDRHADTPDAPGDARQPLTKEIITMPLLVASAPPGFADLIALCDERGSVFGSDAVKQHQLVEHFKRDIGAAAGMVAEDITAAVPIPGATATAQAGLRRQQEILDDPHRPIPDSQIDTLARQHGIARTDAEMLLMYEREAQLVEAAFAAPAPGGPAWLDWSPLPLPPTPWSDDDWRRDKLRAETAADEIYARRNRDYAGELRNLTRAEWQAAAERGEDVVTETLAMLREHETSGLLRQYSGTIAVAQDRARRAEADRAERERRERTGPVARARL